VALLLGANLGEVAELQAKQEDEVLNDEQMLMELESLAAEK